MPKQTFTLNDFSGGANGYVDPLDIADNELAICQGFKPEPGTVIVLGDMKGAYTPSAANGSDQITIESGYGLFSFSHDYTDAGVLAPTNYIVLMDGVTFDIYSDEVVESGTDDDWVQAAFNLLGATLTGVTGFAGTVKPCFFIADGALRVSPGNFNPITSGGDMAASSGNYAANMIYGFYEEKTALDNITEDISSGDTIVLNDQEMIALRVQATSLHVARNMTGLFPSVTNNDDDIKVLMDTRWRGVVKRRNFAEHTASGTFTEWYSTYAHPRPPVLYDANVDHDHVVHTSANPLPYPFLVQFSGGALTVDGELSPCLQVGYYADTTNSANTDATWDGAVINLYCTALYDDAKQESQPCKHATNITVAAATELGIYIAVHYSEASTYRINKRVTGARIYYEDTTGDPGILYQLVEVDFELGCKKAEAETFTPWLAEAANEVVDSHAGGETAANRESDNAGAFVFANPPKAFTYEINTLYPPDVNTHARYKTAVVANRRLFVGNVYQSGKANGDRMLSSPVNKFDILPEYGDFVIDVTQGDGDEIVKLEAYADRLLQFKKRTLYIINIGGGLGEEFLESQHRNMGVENPSQTCMTEYGVVWVNAHGVFLYDGQEITDLTLNKLQLTNTTTADRPRALNIIEANIPTIGYHPDNKWLIINVASDTSTSFEAEAWIHDFKNGSWTYSQEFSADADYKSNMIWTPDNNLVFAAGTNSSNTPDFFKYRDAGTATPAQGELILRTKDFHLDAPGVKKKLKSVYVTYSANGSTEIQAHVLYQKASGTATVDSEMEEVGGGTTYYTEADGFKTTSNAVYTVELKPSTAVTDALSFQFQLYNEDAVALATGNFKLYNISFVYRPLGTR
jgi:hypothetical protein